MSDKPTIWWRIELGSGGAVASVTAVETAEKSTSTVFYVQAETEDSARYAGRAAFNAYMRDFATKRRARLKASGKCPWCGLDSDRGAGKRCTLCVERDARYRQRERDKTAGLPVPKLNRMAAITERRDRENREVAEKAVLSASAQIRLDTLREVQNAWLDNRTVGAFSAWLNGEIEKLAGKRVA